MPAPAEPDETADSPVEPVVFDLDGVLVDSEELWDEVRRELAAAAGVPWPSEATTAMMGMSTAEWSTYLVETVGAAGKPSPLVSSEVVASLGSQPGRTVAIEDSSNGLRSASAAGLVVLALPHPAFPPAADALALADGHVDSRDALTVELVEQVARRRLQAG